MECHRKEWEVEYGLFSLFSSQLSLLPLPQNVLPKNLFFLIGYFIFIALLFLILDWSILVLFWELSYIIMGFIFTFFACGNSSFPAVFAHHSWKMTSKGCVITNGLAEGSSCLLLRCEPDSVVWQPDRNCSANKRADKTNYSFDKPKIILQHQENHTQTWCKACIQFWAINQMRGDACTWA